MIRPPNEQEEYVRSIGAKFSTGQRLWSIECGTWQALYQEIFFELQLAKRLIEKLEREKYPLPEDFPEESGCERIL